jgi:hypothetical protein
MDTLLVRLKPHDARRGHVLRRYTYLGIKLHQERGWYRVAADVAEYLRSVRRVVSDEYSPLAFDVCTDEEAKTLDSREESETKVRRAAADEIKLSEARRDDVPLEVAPRPAAVAPKQDNPKPPKEK